MFMTIEKANDEYELDKDKHRADSLITVSVV